MGGCVGAPKPEEMKGQEKMTPSNNSSNNNNNNNNKVGQNDKSVTANKTEDEKAKDEKAKDEKAKDDDLIDTGEEAADESELITLNEGIRDFYDIGNELGSGAYSVVYKATNKASGENVAIKCIDLCMIESEATPGVDPLLPLKREIKILKKIDHPNIIKLFEVFADEEKFYMVMELIPGEELFNLISTKGCFSENHARKLFRQIVVAVAYLHGQGIAHRDLKPENILIQGEGDNQIAKLADFGFAKYFKEDQMKTALGSPGYAAPELFVEESYKETVDMWSLGVILFVLLSGEPPFFGQNLKELTDKIIAADFTFNEPWEAISDEAKSLVCHLLVKDPAKRYTAAQCVDDPWVKGTNTES